MRSILLLAAVFAASAALAADEKPAAPANEANVCHVELRGVLKVWPHQAFGGPAVTVKAAGAEFQVDYSAMEPARSKESIKRLDGRPVIVKGDLTFREEAGKQIPLITARSLRALVTDLTPPAGVKKE